MPARLKAELHLSDAAALDGLAALVSGSRGGRGELLIVVPTATGTARLRLGRDWTLEGLRAGQWRELDLSGQPDARRRVNVPNASKNRGVINTLPKLR